MGALELSLVAAALAAGLTGTWSPCGFSMIETLGRGHDGGARTTVAACLTFTLGALAGGVVTFGSLAAVGALVHGADDRAAYLVAACVSVAAALAEARGTPIVPQMRRQLPEPWRRTMPMPVAAGLYGVLLGLGFTTFVLTFGVFALAGIALALGDPALGAAVGFAFGVGRALPVALTAPFAERPAGIRVTELMAERPALYRAFRAGDALALAAAAAALVATVPAGAVTIEHRPAADPSTAENDLAFQLRDRSGVLRRGGVETALPGNDPAVGGDWVAVLREDEIVLLQAQGLGEVERYPAAGADAVDVSDSWIAWRVRDGTSDRLFARRILNPQEPGPIVSVADANAPAQIGRPTLDGDRLVYAVANRRKNRILKRVLGTGEQTTLRRSRADGLSNPSLRGPRLLYVRHERNVDRLILGGLGGGGRTLYSRRSGTLWSTALGRRRAYVTLIRGTTPAQRILSVKR